MDDGWIVSTALESTWPNSGRVRFFGPWAWAKVGIGAGSFDGATPGFEIETLPYHWDDRDSFFSDTSYLASLTDRAILQLAEELNCIHGTRHSQRYWRILIGWWVRMFVDVYFDRWTVIRMAAERWPGSSMYGLSRQTNTWAEAHSQGFLRACLDDPWNERLWTYLAETEFNTFDLQPVDTPSYCPTFETDSQDNPSRKDRFHLSQAQRIAYLDDYGPPRSRLKMDLALRQLPQCRALPPDPLVPESSTSRNWALDVGSSAFEASLGRALIMHLPTCYLEGYDLLVDASEATPWPTSPEVVAFSTAQYTSGTYAHWLGERAESGASLIAIQHGGTYGVARQSSALDHDLSICDEFFTWGWELDQAHPAPTTKLIGLREANCQAAQSLLFVVGSPYRYSNWLASTPLPPQHDELIRRHDLFLAGLRGEILGATVARVLDSSLGWGLTCHLQSRHPQIQVVGLHKPFRNAVEGARVVVCTDNSTTCVESMAMGAPTVLTWPREFNEMTEAAASLLDQLESVGVYYADAGAAARHVAQIWHDPHSWWLSHSVQEAVASWLQFTGRTWAHPYSSLARALKSAAPSENATLSSLQR